MNALQKKIKLNAFKVNFKPFKLFSLYKLTMKNKNDENIEFPDVSTCCGRGCANCVWLQYSENLMKYYKDDKLSSKKLNEAIEKLEDENLKTFLRFELRDKLKKETEN